MCRSRALGLIVPLFLAPAGAWAAGYRVTSARVGVTVTTWGPDCGPRPQDEHPPTGGAYQLQADGALTPEGGGLRLFDDKACAALTQQRDLTVERTWDTLRCRSPEGAGKVITATLHRVQAGPGLLQVAHDIRYVWTLKGSTCDVTIAGRYELEDPAQRPAPVSAGPDCSEPGEPARLEMVGPVHRAAPDQGRVRFQVRVLDAAGCEAPGDLTWTSTAGRVSPDGVLDLQGTTPSGPIGVSAHVDTLEAKFTVEVAQTEADYQSLTVTDPTLAHGALPSLPPQKGEALVGDAGPIDRDEPTRARLVTALFVALVLVATGAAVWVAARAARRRPSRAEALLDDHAREVLERSAAAKAAKAAQAGKPAQPARSALICPKCGTQYPADAVFCGTDGTRLQGLN